MNAPIIPPVTNDDRLPHSVAVWRDVDFPADDRGSARQVSVDYGGGLIECTTAERVDWSRVVCWRFGWPPKASGQ